ncbi:MAG: twin-arginine translocation signal domain-containing protein [Pseudobutyrivibrio sp.]|nr:twin-arginine translocation signal domain-containing protein [Pseudobutyrivibrio sp.]
MFDFTRRNFLKGLFAGTAFASLVLFSRPPSRY